MTSHKLPILALVALALSGCASRGTNPTPHAIAGADAGCIADHCAWQVPSDKPSGKRAGLVLSGVVFSHSAPHHGVVVLGIEVDSTGVNGSGDRSEVFVPVSAEEADGILVRGATGDDPRIGYGHAFVMADITHAVVFKDPPKRMPQSR